MDKFNTYASNLLNAYTGQGPVLSVGDAGPPGLYFALASSTLNEGTGVTWTEVSDTAYNRIALNTIFTTGTTTKFLSPTNVLEFGPFIAGVTITGLVIAQGAAEGGGTAGSSYMFEAFSPPVSVSAGNTFRFNVNNLSIAER